MPAAPESGSPAGPEGEVRRRFSRPRVIAGTLLVGVLACLVGLASRPPTEAATTGDAGHPDVVVLAGQVLLYLLVAVGIVVGAMLASSFWPQRRNRPPDEPEWVIERPPTTLVDRLMVAGVVAVLLAAAAGTLWLAIHFLGTPVGPGPTSGSAPATAFPRPGAGPPPSAAAAQPADPWLAAAVVVALLVAGALAAAWWPRRRASGDGSAPLRRGAEVAEALDASVEALRSDPDPRRAVITAYGAMERSLAAAGVGRRPFEGPYEYLRRALRLVAAAPDEISLLTRLFGLAKFSRHRIDETSRHQAIDALVTVRERVRHDP
jgi:hypothetical protein